MLALDFTLCQTACDKLVFTETTGTYSSSNLTGYGSPNDATNAFVNPSLTLENVSGGDPIEVSLPASFPSSNSTYSYTITLGSDLEDGVYLVTYTIEPAVAETTDTYEQSYYILFACGAQCCVQKLFTIIDNPDCDNCNSSKLQNALKAFALLKSAEYNAKCGDASKAVKLLNAVNYICSSTNCNC